MSDNLRQLIDEAIKLEFIMAEIYLSFHHRFPEDANFWWKMALEEKNHAALLNDWKKHFLDAGMFPRELVGESLDILVNMNSTLKGILMQEKEAPPSRIVAFNLALKLEELAGEVHFQHAMRRTGHLSKTLKLFQSLNAADKNHVNTIRGYMSKNGIDITCD